MQVNSFVRMAFVVSLFSFSALAAFSAGDAHAAPAVYAGLHVTTEVIVCSTAAWSCTSSVSVGLHVDVADKSDAVGVGLGDVLASGITDVDGKGTIALAPGTYQAMSDDRIADTCAYGWMSFGTGCLGPKFVVHPSELTSLHLQFVRWVD